MMRLKDLHILSGVILIVLDDEESTSVSVPKSSDMSQGYNPWHAYGCSEIYDLAGIKLSST